MFRHRSPATVVQTGAVVAATAVVLMLTAGGDGTLAGPPDPDDPASAPPSTELSVQIAETTPASSSPSPEEPETEQPETEQPESPGAEDSSDDEPSQVGAEDVRPVRPSSVSSSDIPVGSIILAVAILVAVGIVARVIMRRQHRSVDDEVDPAANREQRRDPGVSDQTTSQASDIRTLKFLLELGETLVESGIAVPQVEATLHSVAATYGIEGIGAIVLPNSLVLSVPFANDVRTDVGTTASGPLRLDQMDDVTQLVRDLTTGTMTVAQAHQELARIRASSAPFTPTVMLSGYIMSTIGLVLILGGTWKEVLLGGALGATIGALLVATRRIENVAYVPFQPLIAAFVCSTAVYTASRFVDGLIIFPVLVAPLVTLLPGAKLTMGILELVTGHIVAGTARVTSGGMQLVLLSLGIVAGAQLLGSGGDGRSSTATGLIAELAPWAGVAVFGLGVVVINGAFRSSRAWILVVLYVAYSGQVMGALFFGPSLSAFFGAVAMTPVAILAARQPHGPSPLVTFLPAFWILVPGALGLKGVALLLGEGGSDGASTLVTTLSSMVGIALGILLGLTLVARNPSRLWITAVTPARSR